MRNYLARTTINLSKNIELNNEIDHIKMHLLQNGIQCNQKVVIQAFDIYKFTALFLAVKEVGALPVIFTQTRDIESNVYCEGPAVYYDASFNLVIRNVPLKNSMSNLGISDEIGVILQTSGTTGTPQFVSQTNKGIYYQASSLVNLLEYTSSDRLLMLVPPWSAYGLTILYVWLHYKIPVIITNHLKPSELTKIISYNSATVIDATPFFYKKMVSHLEQLSTCPKELNSVRAWCCGGDALPLELAMKWFTLTGKPILDGYGSSEAGGNIAINTPSHYKQGTVGKALPGTEIKLAEDGEVLVKSPSVLGCDTDNPNKVSTWLRTGDIGKFDSDGFLSILGRTKNTLSINGFIFNFEQVENVLLSHDGVIDAAVMLRTHKDIEYLDAMVELSKPLRSSSLREHCHKHLPNAVKIRNFYRVKNLKYSPNGKLNRKILLHFFEENLNHLEIIR